MMSPNNRTPYRTLRKSRARQQHGCSQPVWEEEAPDTENMSCSAPHGTRQGNAPGVNTFSNEGTAKDIKIYHLFKLTNGQTHSCVSNNKLNQNFHSASWLQHVHIHALFLSLFHAI